MRDKSIDCFKGILTLQMILAHCFQFFCNLDAEKGYHLLTEYINLTTFSGFIFAFGYVSYTAYLREDAFTGIKKLVKNALRLLAAFYISSFTYVIFIEGIPLRWDKVLEILFLQRLAGWSEFLIAFAAVMLITIPLIWLLKHKNIKLLLLLAVISSLACFLPPREVKPILGIFIGGYGNAYYPVISYYLYFIIGIYFVRKKIRFNPYVLVAAIAGTAYTIYTAHYVVGGFPSRFPLTFAWLTGGMLFLYGYYMLSSFLGNKKCFVWLGEIGKNSLFYLLFSNFIIFSMKRTKFYKINGIYSWSLYVIILVVTWYMICLVKGSRKYKTN